MVDLQITGKEGTVNWERLQGQSPGVKAAMLRLEHREPWEFTAAVMCKYANCMGLDMDTWDITEICRAIVGWKVFQITVEEAVQNGWCQTNASDKHLLEWRLEKLAKAVRSVRNEIAHKVHPSYHTHSHGRGRLTFICVVLSHRRSLAMGEEG